MLLPAWAALAVAQPAPDEPVSRPTPKSDDWAIRSTDFANPPVVPCAYGGVRSCLATYQGPELCAAVQPFCDLGSQEACTVARTDECACLARDPAACTRYAKGLSAGGDEPARVSKVLEDPCLAGVMTACTAITGHLLRSSRPELARPWLVFTCDRGVKAECVRLEALPPEAASPPAP